MTPDLQKALADLSAKLGVGIDYLWPLLVKNARIEAITYMSVEFLFVLAGVSICVYNFRLRKNIPFFYEPYGTRTGYQDETVYRNICWTWIPLGVSLINLVLMILDLPVVLTPEAHTLMKLLGR